MELRSEPLGKLMMLPRVQTLCSIGEGDRPANSAPTAPRSWTSTLAYASHVSLDSLLLCYERVCELWPIKRILAYI